MKKTKESKKEYIRKEIIKASEIYRDKLAGKVFLFIYSDNWFEVVFKTDRFLHLTGVSTQLSAQDFYNKATKKKLTEKQFDFTKQHPFETARKKLPCLIRLPELTTSLVCVVKDLATITLTYKIGLTNLDFTLGLTENIDADGAKINNWFLPRTLRTKDRAIETSKDSDFIDFVLEKNAAEDKYTKITFDCNDKEFPSTVHQFLSNELLKKSNTHTQF